MTITLLQELLRDRTDCFVLLRGQSVFCSCGHVSSDVKNLENHIVTHERAEFVGDEQRANEVVSVHLAELKRSLECVGLNEERLEVPPKTHYVTLAEEDIGGGYLADASCPRCPGLVLKDFADLESHFSQFHGGLWAAEGTIRTKSDFVDRKRREKTWAYNFFCPIPGCKYHVREPERKWFTELKLLRQHYVKVHAAKKFPCPSEGCPLTFANAAALARHLASECGREFACETCGVKYRSHENLLTHGRRRGHSVDRKRSEEKARREADKRRFAAVTRGDVARIAPRPSHLHLSAAIALSELSAKRYLVDVGIQTESSRYSSTTQTTVSPRKRTTETQTLKKRKRAKKQSASATASAAATSPVMVDADVDFDLGVIAKDRPLWTASSTQTSPKWGPDPSTSEFPPGGVASSSAAALMRAPRLGDIEQFNSTETQTESNAVAGGGSNTAADDDWDSITAEFGLRQFMEAETQFDIDDILCSNYTQTRFYVTTYGYDSEKIGLAYASLGNVKSSPILLEAMEEEPPNSAASFLPASTTSTQTLFEEQETSASSKHMETQTG